MSLKVITGDNALVAATVARAVGLRGVEVVTGLDLRQMSDGALLQRVGRASIFAEVEPNQKERIVLALRKAGHVVGYLGDGINDASALHAADVGLSVESAVDVAKDVADIVLLEKDLEVLVAGVREGRATFANTLKYVLMATSANFGNMFSMAGACRRPFFRSSPGRYLLLATLGVVTTVLALPLLPFANLLGLVPLAPSTLALLALIVAAYVMSGELVKRVFYRLAEPAREPLQGRSLAIASTSDR